jgi:hypothetical protein
MAKETPIPIRLEVALPLAALIMVSAVIFASYLRYHAIVPIKERGFKNVIGFEVVDLPHIRKQLLIIQENALKASRLKEASSLQEGATASLVQPEPLSMPEQSPTGGFLIGATLKIDRDLQTLHALPIDTLLTDKPAQSLKELPFRKARKASLRANQQKHKRVL